MKRRDFLKIGALTSVPIIFDGFPLGAVSSFLPVNPGAYNDKILVMIQLDGGNDTLNTVIPLEYYSVLNSLRSNILIPENKTLNISDKVGLHPSLSGLKEIYDQGNLNIIRAVGYPNQNRSHFRSTDIWMSATDAQIVDTSGWLGRFFTLDHPDFPTNYPNETVDYPFAITMGSTPSETCQGIKANYSIAVSDPSNTNELFEGEWNYTPNNCYGQQLEFVRETVRQSNLYSTLVSNAYSKGKNVSTKYPEGNKLADSLKVVARLISGGLKTKVYVLRLGGFDTHSGQVSETDKTQGNHADLLKMLSDAIFSFQDDLNLLQIDQRVLGLTFSEFGRQIRSNASFGTDHGTAVDLFMFGSCVAGGMTGINQPLTTDQPSGEGVAMQTNFRQIYSTILTDWFGLAKSYTDEVLFGAFGSLGLISGCDINKTGESDIDDNLAKIYPNPASNHINLEIRNDFNYTNIDIRDNLGKVVKKMNIGKGEIRNFSIKTDISTMSSGIYYIEIYNSSKKTIKKLVKL